MVIATSSACSCRSRYPPSGSLGLYHASVRGWRGAATSFLVSGNSRACHWCRARPYARHQRTCSIVETASFGVRSPSGVGKRGWSHHVRSHQRLLHFQQRPALSDQGRALNPALRCGGVFRMDTAYMYTMRECVRPQAGSGRPAQHHLAAVTDLSRTAAPCPR